MYALIVIIILHFRVQRIEAISDENSFKEFDKEMVSSNPLVFLAIKKSRKDQKKTGLNEAIVTGWQN